MNKSLIQRKILIDSILQAFLKLDPRVQIRNPVMFITEIGAVLTTFVAVQALMKGHSVGFEAHLAVWLWFTVVFANFSEAMAEGRGKAQAESLKKARTQ